jgi:ADP-ribose pyrophosphatase
MNESDVEIVDSAEVWRGYCRVRRVRLRHRTFGGGWTDVMTREVIERGHAACVLPYDPAADRVVLLEQFRIGPHAAGGSPWQIEMVAGIIEPGESPETVVRREAVEECGCAIDALEPICTYFASPGVLTETIALFCGRTDAAGVGGVFGLAHEHEDIRSFAVGFDEAFGWIANGRLRFGPAIIALQWLALNRGRLRQAWAAGGNE